MGKKIQLVLRLGAAWAFAHILWIVSSGFRDAPGPARAALVLGNKVEESGIPSERLLRRLHAAYDLYRSGHVTHIVVSGGLGEEGHNEALVMRDQLIAFGVRESSIIVDTEGVDTLATARNYAETARAQGLGAPVIVTDYFHIERVRLALRQCGVDTPFSSHAEFDFHIKELWYVPREMLATYAYLLWKKCR